MRSFVLIFLTVLIFMSYSGCRKYEEGPLISLRKSETRIYGKWDIIKYYINGNITEEMLTLQVFDIFGRKIKEQKLRSLFSQVDMSNYVKGMYLIIIKTGNKVYLNEKVIYL